MRNCVVPFLTTFLLTTCFLKAQVTPPFSTSFETGESYSTGNLHGQNGWVVDQGTASVQDSVYRTGGQAIEIPGNTTFGQIRLPLNSFTGSSITFTDLYIKPTASAPLDEDEFLDVEASLVAFFKISGSGEVHALDGDGSSGGTWVASGASIAVDGQDLATDWVQITIRQDFTGKTWDLFVDGELVLVDLGFYDDAATYAPNVIVLGSTTGPTYLDDIQVSGTNPLFTDVDRDGMEDGWETANGLSISTNDRNLDPDGDGLTNIVEYKADSDPGDYYNGETPQIAIVSGNSQAATIGDLFANPLVVEVRDQSNALLVNAPVTFSVDSGKGTLSLDDDPFAPELEAETVTNGSGQAQIYVKASYLPQAFVVTAEAGPEGLVDDIGFALTSSLPSGALLWLKADAGVTLDGSGNVSQWDDQSGNSNHASQTSSSARPTFLAADVNGKPGLDFPGGKYLQMPSGFSDFTDGATYIIVTRTKSVVTNERYLSFTTGAWNMNPMEFWRNGTSEGVGVFLDGTSGFTSYTAPNVNPPDNSYRAISMCFDPVNDTVEFYRNGVLAGSSASSLTPNVVTRTHNFIGTSPNTSESLNGGITEILVYPRALSSIEKNLMDSYIASKFHWYHPSAEWISSYEPAIQLLIHEYKWTKMQADSLGEYLVENPDFPVDGLQLWLRADAGVTLDGNGNVVSWEDQSGNGKHSQQTNFNLRPSFVSEDAYGLPGIEFSASKSLQMPPGFSDFSSGASLIVVTRTQTTVSNERYMSFTTGAWNLDPMEFWRSGTSNGIGVFINSTTGFHSYTAANVHPPDNNYRALAMHFDSINDTVKFFCNGGLVASATSTITPIIKTKSHNFIGSSPNPAESLDGGIAEVLVYNRALTEIERDSLDAHIATRYKWYHVDAEWISSYPTNIQALIHNYKWNKKQADALGTYASENAEFPVGDLALWLKADAGITTDGSNNISNWSDQSGNEMDAEQSNASIRPQLSSTDVGGKPSVVFPGGKFLTLPDGFADFSQGVTMVLVTRASAATTWSYPLNLSTGDGVNAIAFQRYGGTNDMRFFFDNAATGKVVLGSEALAANNSYHTFAGIFDPVELHGTFVRDGLIFATADISGVPPFVYRTSNFIAGHALGSEYYYNGAIAELLLYRRALGNSEISELSIYFAEKYLFPVRVDAPLVTPGGGVFGSAQNVSISSLPSFETRYTTTGFGPTSSSPLYTTILNMTQSTLLKAAYFYDGKIVSAVTTAQFYISDTDEDGMSDTWEIAHGLDEADPDDADSDLDHDGLSAFQEYNLGLDPNATDSNSDGLADSVSLKLGIDPAGVDSDGDSISNADEMLAGTNPLLADTDGDGVPDNVDAYPLDPTRWEAPDPDSGDTTPPQITLIEPANAVPL